MAHRIDDPEYPGEWQFSNGGVPICSAFTETLPVEPRCDLTIDMFQASELQDD
ncbi:hypothetical protein [Cognatiyoonia sp. IB215182]|uniref:hypothetical protein n=1 Tax=Cognatiyoonia sp. IB215182 TaxID=3097353 RepID=UPI002A12EFA7|nr:hypothetical protein [Cognatiyoonia sp. IB215182]MDX8354341.1 hypothetical protein [Cognatiyoonia sp. IB215182]